MTEQLNNSNRYTSTAGKTGETRNFLLGEDGGASGVVQTADSPDRELGCHTSHIQFLSSLPYT